MSIECGDCERDARSGHDKDCPRFNPLDGLCTCDPEWQADCPVHTPAPPPPQAERLPEYWADVDGVVHRRSYRSGRLSVYIDRDDWWVGVYFGPNHVYVCPLPCLVVRWRKDAQGAGHA